MSVQRKIKTAILISGRGSNMEALLEAASAPDFPADITLVASDKADAAGLSKASSQGFTTRALPYKSFENKAAFEDALHQEMVENGIEIICLAGFMRLLSADFTERWAGRILNIHPSLLPLYKGLHTHERVLADKRTESGCTIHFVTADMDDGPIIMQSRVPVDAKDTPETLAARILKEEHKLYPKALRKIAVDLLKNS